MLMDLCRRNFLKGMGGPGAPHYFELCRRETLGGPMARKFFLMCGLRRCSGRHRQQVLGAPRGVSASRLRCLAEDHAYEVKAESL